MPQAKNSGAMIIDVRVSSENVNAAESAPNQKEQELTSKRSSNVKVVEKKVSDQMLFSTLEKDKQSSKIAGVSEGPINERLQTENTSSHR